MGENVMKKGKKLREDTHGSPTLSGAGGAWSRYLYPIQKRMQGRHEADSVSVY
jgi:hypothetical protein